MPEIKGKLRIGTSGYQYTHWKNVFYPADIPKKEWFHYYTKYFDTVEINNTFYNLPAESTFKKWHDAAPGNFLYALKFSRYGSHIKRLKDPVKMIERFIDNSKPLNAKRGPILLQLPPRWDFNPERLDSFLRNAPDFCRWAVEFRDQRWLRKETYEILGKYKAALCLHDLIRNHPRIITAGWTYLRFHGNRYEGSYGTGELENAAGIIKKYLSGGIDVYVYFNNDENAYAVQNAMTLKKMAITE